MTNQTLFFFILSNTTINNSELELEQELDISDTILDITGGIIPLITVVIIIGLTILLSVVPGSTLIPAPGFIPSKDTEDNNPPRTIDLFFSHIPVVAPAVVFDRNDLSGTTLRALFALKQN